MIPEKLVEPFVASAEAVFQSELQAITQRGGMALACTQNTVGDVTMLVGIAGEVSGVVLYAMEEATARQIAGHMLGSAVDIFDRLAQSAVGELSNIISGKASSGLEAMGYRTHLTPPTIIVGRDTVFAFRPFYQVQLPLTSPFGDITISVSLEETPF